MRVLAALIAYELRKPQFFFICALVAVLTVVLGAMTASAQCNPGDLGGEVYRDYDASATREAQEPGVAGVQVTAFDANNAIVASAVTGSDGSYVLAVVDGTPVRIEFSQIPSALQPGPQGSGSVTTVAFRNRNSCDVNLALNNPAQYCGDDADLATTCFVGGDANGGGTAGLLDTVIGYPYDVVETDSGPTHYAFNSETGSVWGLAYQRASKSLFAAAYLKRHSGFGPMGSGGIYRIDLSDPTNPVVSNFIDLQACGITTGDVSNADRTDLPANINFGGIPAPSFDVKAFGEVGRDSFGDMEMSEDDRRLLLVNLHTRELHRIAVNTDGSSPNCSDVETIAIPNPNCSGGDYAPFAIKQHDGLTYVGVVCTAQTSQDPNDLVAHLMMLSDVGFSSIFSWSIASYPHGFGLPLSFLGSALPNGPSNQVADGVGGIIHPWITDFSELGLSFASLPFVAFYVYDQLIWTNIEFDSDGSIIAAFRNRWTDMLGNLNYLPYDPSDPTSPNFGGDPLGSFDIPAGGDIVRLCARSGGYVLENNGQCPGEAASAGAGNSEGPGGGEYYYLDVARLDAANPPIGDAHRETSVGALALKYGSGEVASNVINPTNLFASAGTHFYNNADGSIPEISGVKRAYPVYVDSPGLFGKASGLGDIDLMCAPAPIEIGNRVWLDTNGNCIQDAAEVGISGVTVSLYDANGQIVATTTTDVNGEYYFRSSQVNIQPSGQYSVRIENKVDFENGGPLSALTLTCANQGNDGIDSDAGLVDGNPRIDLTTGGAGFNNHTYDFGFSAPQCQEKVLGDISATLDGVSVDYLLQSKRQFKRIKRSRARGACSISRRALKRAKEIVGMQNVLHNSIWTDAWSFGATTTTCDQEIAACVTVDITATTEAIRTDTATMKSNLDTLLNNRCLRHQKRRTNRARRRSTALQAESDKALSELGTSVTSCSL